MVLRIRSSLVVLLVTAGIFAACSKDEKKAPAGDPFGNNGGTGGVGVGGGNAQGGQGANAGSTGKGGTGGGVIQDGGVGGSSGTGNGGGTSGGGPGGTGNGGGAGTGNGGGNTGGSGTGGVGGVGGSGNGGTGGDWADAYTVTPCPTSPSAVNARTLVAGGSTPTAFADAYNAEMKTKFFSGHLLLAFHGMNQAQASNWKMQIGGFAALDGSAGYTFLNSPAVLPFVYGGGNSVEVAPAMTSFSMHFDTPTTKVDIPVMAFSLKGAFDGACAELGVDVMTLMIPTTAGNLQFHGSTVSALMGAPTVTVDAGVGAWMVELLGTAIQAPFSGGAP